MSHGEVRPLVEPDPVDQVELDPSRPYAAYVSAFLTVVGVVVFAWLTDATPRRAPQFTLEEFKEALKGGLLAAGLTGLGTFATKKPLREKLRPSRRNQRGEANIVRTVVYALVALFVLILLIVLVRHLGGA